MVLAIFNGSWFSSRPTGLGVVAEGLANALDPHKISLTRPLDNTGEGNYLASSNLTKAGHGTLGHIQRLIWTQKELPIVMRERRAQLLLSPVPEAPVFQGIRSIVIAHDLIPIRYPRPSPLLAYHLLYVPIVLHSAELVLCNSEATAREVHEKLRIPTHRLEVIRLGFDPGVLRPLNIERAPFLLVLGRHDPHKNLRRVLEAFALSCKSTSYSTRDLELYLVGPHDRRYTPRLKYLAEELGIGHRCHWIPWVGNNDRLLLLNRCQALVITSMWEGFGLPALEAMACGTPVIASNTGALPEVVGDAGLLVNPLSSQAIAMAINEVIRDPLILHESARKGPARAAQFRWDATARHVEELLEYLV